VLNLNKPISEINESRPSHLVNRASRLVMRVGEARLAPLGFSTGQLPILGALRDGKSMRQKDLAGLAFIEQPTMAQTLARMERDGIIRREPDPADKRSSLISLTPEAMSKLDRLYEVMIESNLEALEGFDEGERVMLMDLLTRFIRNLEKMAGR
jgi:DNA-binding MarR family transcriptional regulator